MFNRENGSSLVEVMIASLILMLVSMCALYVYASGSLSVDNSARQGQAQIAESSMLHFLNADSEPLQWNGATIMATSDSIPSDISAAPTVSSIQNELSLLPGSQMSISVTSVEGNGTCPCSVTSSVSWTGGSIANSEMVQY